MFQPDQFTWPHRASRTLESAHSRPRPVGTSRGTSHSPAVGGPQAKVIGRRCPGKIPSTRTFPQGQEDHSDVIDSLLAHFAIRVAHREDAVGPHPTPLPLQRRI